MAETQTCPRRIHEMGPWAHEPHLDRWTDGGWSDDLEEAEKRAREKDQIRRDKFGDDVAQHPTQPQVWLGPGSVPRFCSFCGSLHPDDAIELVELGWEVIGTTKTYKRYLEPPGTALSRSVTIKRLRGNDKVVPPSVWKAQLKVYIMHFDKDQAKRWNEALEK